MQIFATDIDKEAVDMARTGLYPGSITVDVSPERLDRFFTKKDSADKKKEGIRQMRLCRAGYHQRSAVYKTADDQLQKRPDLFRCRAAEKGTPYLP